MCVGVFVFVFVCIWEKEDEELRLLCTKKREKNWCERKLIKIGANQSHFISRGDENEQNNSVMRMSKRIWKEELKREREAENERGVGVLSERREKKMSENEVLFTVRIILF